VQNNSARYSPQRSTDLKTLQIGIDLNPRDDVPQPDYIALSKQFGGCTREMKVAYREGFNGVFKPVNR
jgi:hypothetical protein